MFSIALSTLVEAAVGARGRKRFVEELEQERLWYSGTRGVAVALQQTLPFQLPRIVTELIQAAAALGSGGRRKSCRVTDGRDAISEATLPQGKSTWKLRH